MKNEFLGKTSANMSAFDVAKKWKINPIDFVPILEKGTKHEMEHTDDIDVARRIALDHIVERLDYYDQLDKIEKMHLANNPDIRFDEGGKVPFNIHREFNEYVDKLPKFGYHGTQSETLVNPRPSKDGRYGEGFYLTLDPDTAEYFGRFTKTSEGYSKENESANVFEFDLRGLNLKYYKKAEDMPYIDFDGLNNKNYDGVYFYYEGEIVIFNIHKLPDGKLVHSKNNDINFAKGGRTIAQTPAPASDRVYGSKTNPKGTASDSQLARNIKFNESLIKAIENKVQAHNKDYPSKKVTLSTAKAVVRRGMGAYSKSHRPTITGGAPNSRQAWGLARLNKFLLKKRGVKVKSAYIQDDDLL